MGLNEGEPVDITSPQDLLTTNAAGPLPPDPAEKDFRDTSWFQPDSSHEEATKKHQIWNLENSEEGESSPDLVEDTVSYSSEEATRKNKIPTSKLEPNELDEHGEDIDILSILDLQLDSDELATADAPRQLSKDQLTPTDWISELVPQDSELPTMADMLPEPTPIDPGPAAQADNVMDILFGDADSIESEVNESDAVLGVKPEIEEAWLEENKLDSQEITDAAALNQRDEAPSEFEELTMDSWLTDIMSDMPENSDGDQEPAAVTSDVTAAPAETGELPDWLDFSDPADSLSFDNVEIEDAVNETFGSIPSVLHDGHDMSDSVFSYAQAESEPELPESLSNIEISAEDVEEELNQEIYKAIVESDNEDKGSDKMTQENNLDAWESGLDDDSLNWLADDLDEIDEPKKPEPDQPSAPESENHFQTRDLSQIDLPMDFEQGDEEVAAGAVQAELPNWIKEMAPDADNESVIIPDEDNYQMNDDALSEIISAMESELNVGQNEAREDNVGEIDESSTEDHMPVFEPDNSQILETMFSKHTEPLSKFDMSAPELEEKSYFQSDVDEGLGSVIEATVSELDLPAALEDEVDHAPSEDQLLMDAISAIESEVDEIKELDPSPIAELDFDDESDLPEWLPADDESPNTNPSLPSTTDLPDWLRKPQAENVVESAEPADLGFSEATVEEVHSLSAEELVSTSVDELDEIVSQNTAEDLKESTVESSLDSSSSAEGSLDDDLAQFNWDDIENDFTPVTEFDLSKKSDDDLSSSLFATDGSDLLDELILDATDSDIEASSDLETHVEDELDANSEFDWLDGESIDSDLLDDADLALDELSFEVGTVEPNLIGESVESLQTEADEVNEPELETELDANTFESNDINTPELDLLEEPEISLPNLSLEPELDLISADFNEAVLEEDVISELVSEQVEDDLDMSAWDDMEDAFSPLKEFEDETDVFSAIRDTPRIEETISAESLAGYISKPDWEIEPDENDDVLESGDDFMSTFAEEAGDEVELPSWANELSSAQVTDKAVESISGRSPLFGIDNIVDVAPVIANPVQDLANLHSPQMMEPVAHRKRAHLAAQAAGTVPMSDPTQPVVVPKARQRYQPRFNPTQFDGRPNQQKKQRSRQIGFIAVAAIVALMIGIGFASSYILSFFAG